MLSQAPSRPGLGICVVAVLGAGILSSILLGVLVLPLRASELVFGMSGATRFTASNLIALFAVLAVGRTLLAAWIAKWIVGASGAFVSFGRAVSALLAGGLVGLVAGILAVVFLAQVGTGGFWLLSFAGFIVSVLVLHGGDSGGDRRAVAIASGYKVPPSAPPGWPGSDT